MARPKSLLVSMELTVAGRAHDCRFNKAHRIEKGMRRLTVKDGDAEHNYCLACARTFVLKDLEKLGKLLAEVEGQPHSTDGNGNI